jgi:hypothetical protein
MNDRVAKPSIFIGSSTPNLEVATAIADCLSKRQFIALVWNEGLFSQNESTFDGLQRISKEVDFAIFVWGASDVITAKEQSIAAPRDNVVFETGLFLGSLGRNRVFMVVDKTVNLKIPSDFAGITRESYDGSMIEKYADSAVRPACNAIERSIRTIPIPPYLSVLAGEWKSRYAAGPDEEHREVIDDVVIEAKPAGIAFESGSVHGLVPYRAEGSIYYKNQIIGQWNHPMDRSMAEGLFMLTVSPTADAMYGYSTSRDAHGAMIYGTWVFAKKDGRTEQEVQEKLLWAQKTLLQRTIKP